MSPELDTEQPAKTTLFAWPISGGGNGTTVRKSAAGGFCQ
jgi:hypothetical protein